MNKLGIWEQLLKRIVWLQLGDIKGKKILDFGSGVGVTANKYAKDNQVLAIEPSVESVTERRQENAYEQIVGGMEKLQKQDSDSFDIIFCHNVLEYASEREEIVKELYRVLKPGGMLSIVKHNRLGRIRLETILLNHFEIANDLLDGKDVIVSKYGTIHYYKDSDIIKWCEGLSVSKVYGIRNFWDLQQIQEQQDDAEWQEKMIQIEMRVSEIEEYRAIASFHHMILVK